MNRLHLKHFSVIKSTRPPELDVIAYKGKEGCPHLCSVCPIHKHRNKVSFHYPFVDCSTAFKKLERLAFLKELTK